MIGVLRLDNRDLGVCASPLGIVQSLSASWSTESCKVGTGVTRLLERIHLVGGLGDRNEDICEGIDGTLSAIHVKRR